MGISERREEEKKQLKNLIVDAAMSIYLEEGIDHLSVRNIAKRIDYSPTTLYLYFKDKDHLFLELHDRAFGILNERFQAQLEIQDPSVRLLKLGESYIRFGVENPELYDLIFIMRAPMQVLLNDDCQEWKQGQGTFSILHDTVKECIEQGQLPSGSSEVLSISIWAHVHGLVSLAVRDRLLIKVPQEQTLELLLLTLQSFLESMNNAARYDSIKNLLK